MDPRLISALLHFLRSDREMEEKLELLGQGSLDGGDADLVETILEVAPRGRGCFEPERIHGDWVHDELGLVLEVEPVEQGRVLVLPRDRGSTTYGEPWLLTPIPGLSGWASAPLDALPDGLDEALADGPAWLGAGAPEGQLVLNGLTEGSIELVYGELAWVFCGAGQGAVPTDTVDDTDSQLERDILEERRKEHAAEELAEKKRDGSLPEGLDGLPQWWKDGDTTEFMKRLGKELKDSLDPSKSIPEKVLEREIEKRAAKVLAKMLTEREKRLVLDKLLKKGVPRAKAEKIAERLAKRLHKQYLYKHPALLKPFGALTKFKRLKLLLKSPKVFARTALAKALIKGLGSKLLGVVGLVDDIYTIMKALYLWHQASKAWEGARESHRQADEMEREYLKMLDEMTPEQLLRHLERRKEAEDYLRRLREKHRGLIEKRTGKKLPKIDA